jgi:hypothetical protein
MDKDDLERATRHYWDFSQNNNIDDYLQYYICENNDRLDGKNLLKAELEWAEKNKCITARPCKTLVLLVGLSLEPLLQSTCVHKPQKIALLLNEEGYIDKEWHEFAQHLIKAIKLLNVKDFVGSKIKCPEENPTKGDPASVFKTLVKILHNEEDVVIDITGGKKSMVTGAFMYAAYAGSRISYVDFEDYDHNKRRPYGFGCKIGELSNPYKDFALSEWERVHTLYKRHQFRDAHELLLGPILCTMSEILPETKKPIQYLGAFLDYYEKWDYGDFKGAKQTSNTLGTFNQPSAVKELGDIWYELSNRGFLNKPKGFYGNLSAMKVYIYDELERIRRLIEYKQDYRSAFLRAGGISEIIMIARIVKLVTNPTERNYLLDAFDRSTPGARKVFNAMLNPMKTQINVKKDLGFGVDPCIIPRPDPMNDWWKKTILFNANDGWDVFLTKRNELAHKYFSVPREWAEDALKFAQANFEDFWDQPTSSLSLQTSTLPWSELCQLCGISHYLPPNLMKEI